VSVGNDVVDLDDPETRLDGLHPRWAARVFTAAERAALERAADEPLAGASPWSERHRLHWALWAAKESAYKARKRADAGTVFAPRDFVVKLAPLPREDGVTTGLVIHHGESFTVVVRFDGACLHAVAKELNAAPLPVLARAATVDRGFTIQDPTPPSPPPGGGAARRLASATIASALGLAPERLRIGGRPPALLRDGRATGVCLSLSHHGRFVAFAASLGR
jgi:phosphopantetheinyl transferase (holo-ACP synthase)